MECLQYIVYPCSAFTTPSPTPTIPCFRWSGVLSIPRLPWCLDNLDNYLKIYFKISAPTNLKFSKCKWVEKWQENLKYLGKTCPNVILEWNTGHLHHGGKPAINCMGYGNELN
jgi:hypothetical protein